MRFFPRKLLSQVGQYGAADTAALKLLDKNLLQSAKAGGVSAKVLPSYGQYFAKPSAFAGHALYGNKFDSAKLLATLAGVTGVARYGGEAARPMHSYLAGIGSKINPDAMKMYSGSNIDSVTNIIKPSLAITSKPLMYLDSKLLGGALNMVEHPILASIALPFTLYGAARGGSALLSRLGRARRLNLLRQGIAPKAYRQQAQRLGFK